MDSAASAAMLLAQLEGLVEVARHGNVSRAASALGMTQPALTARLKTLERELGTPLVVRARRGVRLTEAGRAFLPFAERALETVAEGRQLMDELGRGGAGQLVLGAAPAVSTYVLPAVLKRFHAAHPNVQLSVRTGHSEEVLQMVLREEVHLGVTRALRHPDIRPTPLFEEELILVVHPSHPFTRRGTVRAEDIAGERIVLFDRTSSYHELTAAFFVRAGVLPKGVMELDNIDATKKMVQEGLGIALIPASAVQDELADGRLRRIAFSDAAPARQRIVAIRRADAGPPSAHVEAFLAELAGARAPVAAR